MEDYNYLTITEALQRQIEKGQILPIQKNELEGFRKIELKNQSKSGEIYDLMERVRQLNKDTIWIVVDDPSKIVRLEDY